MPLSSSLRAASLPFVTRAMRGGRKVRYTAVAFLLALLSVVLGSWLALGSGDLERELRVGFRLEQPLYEQERLEYKIFAADEIELRALQRQAAALAAPGEIRRSVDRQFLRDYGDSENQQVAARVYEAVDLVNQARADGRDSELRREAQAALTRHGIDPTFRDGDWDRLGIPEVRVAVRSILDRDLIPAVTLYSSPLGLTDAVRVIGLVAGSLVMLLLMLFAPVLAGTQMAQEVHENTLQPLTGTALSARDLVLGMTLGPAAVIALLAAPQVVLLLAAALFAGHVVPALGLVVVALTGGAFLTVLAQIAGLALGRQRSAGMLGVALLGVLAPLTMLAALLAIELPHRLLGMLALLPQAAASHVLLEAFLPAGASLRGNHLILADIASARIAVAVGAAGMLCFAYLGLRALERRVGELAPSALQRGEALLGVLVSTALITLANPWLSHGHHGRGSEFYLINFGIALVPLTILLMLRVPMAEAPTVLRKVPIGALMLEFCAGVGVFFAVCVGCMGTRSFGVVDSPVAMFYLAWMIGVAGLLAIRVAALPMTLLAKIWSGVCTFGLFVAFVHTVQWADQPHLGSDHVLAFSRVSPLLGVLQAVLLFVIPLSLLRALQHPATTAPRPD